MKDALVNNVKGGRGFAGFVGFRGFIALVSLIFLLSACTSTRGFGTTIERDENNACQINMIIQVAVQGTAADVKSVKDGLDECLNNKECFIACKDNPDKGCMVKIKTVVKGFGELKEDERNAFHYVNMIDDDGQPSNAYIGTPNNGASSGTWRRGNGANTWCHEVLHFCGLPDRYCARIFNPVTGTDSVERHCENPPDPNGGQCCSTSASDTRCTVPCEGHGDDIMGAGAPLSCKNVLDVLNRAGFGDCPMECCSSDKTFTRPLPEAYLMPGYFNLNDKNNSFGSFGIGVGGTYYLNPKLGVTLDGGHYIHTENPQDDVKEKISITNITGGVSYNIEEIKPKLSLSAHALLGISMYKQKTTFGADEYKESESSFHLNIGVALNMKINKSWTWRVIQADYAPTFLYDETQQNYRISTGVVYKLDR